MAVKRKIIIAIIILAIPLLQKNAYPESDIASLGNVLEINAQCP